MNQKKVLLIAKLAPLLLAIPVFIYADSGNNGTTGTDSGYSGVPGELGSCAACHTATTTGFGSAALTFPNGPFYTPGTNQHLVLTITDTPQRAWGFQATARQSSSNTTMAGNFVPDADGFTQIVCGQSGFKKEQFFAPCPSQYPLIYIEHSGAGVRAGTPGPVQFQFEWLPPSSNVGPIVIYVAAVGADGDGTASGDHVYTAKYTVTPLQPGQPIITNGGVTSGASFASGSNIAPGSWVTITGTNLANTTRPWAGSDFSGNNLPTALDGVSVMIDNKPAYVSYISPTQINVLSPSDSLVGSVNVAVTNNGTVSNTQPIYLQANAPALFEWTGTNNKYVVATRTDYSLVGPPNLFQGATTVPAKSGDTIILWCTGLGATTPAVNPGALTPNSPLANVARLPAVTIGGLGTTVLSAALAPGFAGLYQLAVVVPYSLSNGDQQVVVQQGPNAISANGVYLNVQN